jgi:hypothetical protein
MTLQETINIPDTLFAQVVDEEMVILDTSSQEYFGLDKIGAVIWQHLSVTCSLQKVYDIMREEYEVKDDQLEADICRFVQELVDADLVQKKSV